MLSEIFPNMFVKFFQMALSSILKKFFFCYHKKNSFKIVEKIIQFQKNSSSGTLSEASSGFFFQEFFQKCLFILFKKFNRELLKKFLLRFFVELLLGIFQKFSIELSHNFLLGFLHKRASEISQGIISDLRQGVLFKISPEGCLCFFLGILPRTIILEFLQNNHQSGDA